MAKKLNVVLKKESNGFAYSVYDNERRLIAQGWSAGSKAEGRKEALDHAKETLARRAVTADARRDRLGGPDWRAVGGPETQNEMSLGEAKTRITRGQLRGLIMSERRDLNEGGVYDLEFIEPLIEFAKAYAYLGNAVQDQLDAILDDPSADVSPNAVALIKEKLGGMNGELDDAIRDYETNHRDWDRDD